jgi:fructose-1,6-bisphosphatase/inositol monophosphatase family enzyme
MSAVPLVPPVEEDLLRFAVDIAREAGELTLGWFRKDGLVVEGKDDGTPVTIADRSAERLLRERIAAAFPDDSVVGEEESDAVGTSGRTWVLDPIDGTQSFVHGVPLYGNLVSLEDEHGPAIGVVNIPGLDECVWAGRGRGSPAPAS